MPRCAMFEQTMVARGDFDIIGEDESLQSVQIGGSIRRRCPSGTYRASGQHITCNWEYAAGDITSYWSGELSYDVMCSDHDECANHAHACSQHCQNRYGGYRCYCDLDAAPKCGAASVDFLFLLDSSNSAVYSDRFRYFQDFVKDLLEPMTIGENEIRVAIATFGDLGELDVAHRFESEQSKE